jgi:uncharacterized coiled-coil protein SlyX
MNDAINTVGEAAGWLSGGAGASAVVYVLARYGVPNAIRTLRHWIKGRQAIKQLDREADANEAIAREQGAASVLPKIMERVTALETRLDERDRTIDALEKRNTELRTAYDQQGAALMVARGDVARLAVILEELLAESDNANARAEVAEIRARNSTPQPFAAVRDTTSAPERGNGTGRHRLRTPALAAVSRRDDMEPHGGEE